MGRGKSGVGRWERGGERGECRSVPISDEEKVYHSSLLTLLKALRQSFTGLESPEPEPVPSEYTSAPTLSPRVMSWSMAAGRYLWREEERGGSSSFHREEGREGRTYTSAATRRGFFANDWLRDHLASFETAVVFPAP